MITEDETGNKYAWEIREAHRIFVGEVEGKRLLGNR
jgi:hypothetical protein